jgi:hypothetical protein
MAEEFENNTGQYLSEYTNLDTNLSKPEDIEPFAGIRNLTSNNYGFGVDDKLNIPGPSIMNNIVGYPDNLPGGQQIGNTKNAFKEFITASSQDIANDESQSSYGKMFNYDAGPDGANFYDRYAAYGDDKFSEIGFHPFRDNQANFNANTTIWNDGAIMMSQSFPVLFSRGFVDGPKSLMKLMSGDFSGADLEDAEEYERAAAMGQSTRGGIGAFFNNTLMNFGYTAGIISEAIVEEIGLSFMTGATGGATGGLQVARTGQIINNIGKGLSKFKTGANTVKELLPKLATPTAARTFWETSMGKKTAALGNLINPLENTVDALKIGKGADYLTNMARLSKTPGAFYRDVRNLNMAISESRLEAGMVENKIFHKLYDDYYKDFSKTPDSDEQFAMRQQAKKGSLETFYANAGIIYVTNKITFGNITSPKGGLNNFLKQTRKDIYEVAAKEGEKKFGTLGKVIFDNTKKTFLFEKNNLANLAKAWWKQPGYATAKKTLGYFKANVSEGIQENLQEAIARANENHYIEAYKMQAPASSLYAKGVNKMNFKVQSGINGSTPSDSYYKELGKEFSAQGFETFMSGFLMGTFARPLNAAMPFLATQKARIFNKEDYTQWKDTKLEVTKGIVDNLNEINVDQLINSRLMNLGTQEKVSLIQKNGSKKEALDAEVDSFVSTMGLMRRTGTTNVFIDKLNSMQELNDVELANAVNSLEIQDVSKYRKRISNGVEKLSSIEEKFKRAEKIFENPVNLSSISADDMQTSEGRALEKLHNAWEKSVENYVYLNTAFEDTAARMVSINNNYLNDTSLNTVDYGAAKVLFQPQSISRQLSILEQELATEQQREDIPKVERSKSVKSKQEQIKALVDFQNAQAIFYGFYQRNETPTINLAVKRLKEDNVENPSEEQIQAKLSELLGDVTDPKKQTEVTQNLKNAHDTYLKSIAKENNATVFQSNLDKAFNDLTDYYKLEFEKRAVAEHIDLLTDPGEFLKLVLENEKVFEKLEEQKNELNSQVIDDQVNKVALDQLLNSLANNPPPLYLNKDQVLNLLQKGEMPEFFTGFKNEIYEPTSKPYEQGKELIDKYNELAKILTSNIDEISGVEMTVEMKKSVQEIKEVFKDSKDIIGFKSGYIKDGNIYSRVSNVMDKLFEDKGYNRLEQIVKSKDRSFINSQGNLVFTQENINFFISEIKKDVKDGLYGINDGGITDETLTNLKTELESLLNGEILNSYQKEISELEVGKTKYEGSLVALENIKLIDEEIAKLSSNKYSKEEITSEVLTKVLNKIMPAITYEAGRVRGSNLDDMVRDYFDSQSELKYENYQDKISEDAFISIFGENGHLTKLKRKVAEGEIYIFSKDLKLADDQLFNKDGVKTRNVAGALDLIIVDKTGKKYIVDLKTGSAQKWDSYLTPGDDNYHYKKYFQNSMQQRAYSNLYFNNSNGENIETLILPISLNEDNKGYITKFNNIPDRAFKTQKTLDNIVDGYMFMNTDNNAKIKSGDVKLRVTDIDELIPRQSIEKESTKLVSESINEEDLSSLEKKQKNIENEIKTLKRRSNVEKSDIEELENELIDLKRDIRIVKKTPESEQDENKEFYKDLRQRRNVAFKNIIQTIGGGRDRIFIETEYENNNGELIKIKKEANLTNPQMSDEDALRIASDDVDVRIEQLYRYDILNYKRKPLIEATVDNLTGRIFNAEIGKVFDRSINTWGEEGALQKIFIDSVYITEEGNYGILAKNLRKDKIYDMVVTPEGDVVSHNNQGAVGEENNPNVTLDDVVFFQEGDFVRKKTEEDTKEETKEENDVITNEIEDAEIQLTNANLNTLELALDSLKADLELEQGEFGNPEYIAPIEDQIKQIEKEIERLSKLNNVDKTITPKVSNLNEISIDSLVKDINNESKTDTSKMYDQLQDLFISESLENERYEELKKLLDLKANALLGTNQLIESKEIYIFKEPFDSKKIKMGDQITVQKLNGSNKTISVKKLKYDSKMFSMTVEEFESLIDFGNTPVPSEGLGKKEIQETGDIIVDFLNDKESQKNLDESKIDYFDTTNDNDIFNNCKS